MLSFKFLIFAMFFVFLNLLTSSKQASIFSSAPHPPPLSLSIALYECSALVLSESFVLKDLSQCSMPDWRRCPPAPSLY